MRVGIRFQLFYEARIGHILEKQRGNFFLADLAYQLRQIARRGLRIGADAKRRDEIDAVGFCEIAEGVMCADDFTFIFGDGGDLCFYPIVQSIEFLDIGACIGFILARMRGIGGGQRIADIGPGR